MWYGKICIIMWLFSISLQFGAYEINQVFHEASLDANADFSLGAINTLANSFQTNAQQQLNPAFIFGDFWAGLGLLFSVVTGHPIALILAAIPASQIWMGILFQIIFTSSSLFLLIYMVANRSV